MAGIRCAMPARSRKVKCGRSALSAAISCSGVRPRARPLCSTPTVRIWAPHLGHGGRVDGESLRCPFHGWTFDETGACVAIPYSADAALDRRRAASWPLVQQAGILFAWWHPGGEAPRFELDRLDDAARGDWSRYRRHRWSVASVWQELQ